MGKAYPVLTSETSVQDPQTASTHLQSPDFSQVNNIHFKSPHLADFCHSKFLLRYKLLVSQVHSPLAAHVRAHREKKKTAHPGQIYFIFEIKPGLKLYEMYEAFGITLWLGRGQINQHIRGLLVSFVLMLLSSFTKNPLAHFTSHVSAFSHLVVLKELLLQHWREGISLRVWR